MASGMVNPAVQRQLSDARTLIAETRDALVRFGATTADQTALAQSIAQLDDFFLLVVVGEFNSGKSAFINALIGAPVLTEGVTPTTAEVHMLRHGDTPTVRARRLRLARGRCTGRSSSRHPYRRHARHECHSSRARAPHRAVRAALRPRAVRHV